MSLEPITREEHFMARAAGNPGLDLEPITRTEYFLKDIADSGGGGGGGSVTPESIVTATGQMTPEQAYRTRENLGAAAAETVVEVSGTTPTITPEPNTVYNCGELTSLTISNPPANGKYAIVFYSGATPTTTVGIANFTAEANKRYEITVKDNYATYDSWPYTPT